MRQFILLLLGVLPSALALADISVEAWSRATPPGATSAAIYGQFSNDSDRDRIVDRIGFTLADHAMVHETRQSDGVARMQANELLIPAGKTLELKPGSMHIMLMGLSAGLVQGCEYQFELTWGDGSVSQHSFRTGGFGQMKAPDGEGVPCP